jgi:hypothetical protein
LYICIQVFLAILFIVVIFWACILGAKGRRPCPVSIEAHGVVSREAVHVL